MKPIHGSALTTASSLDAVLNAAGRDHWSQEAVEAYKASQVARYPANWLWYAIYPARKLSSDPEKVVTRALTTIAWSALFLGGALACACLGGLIAMLGDNAVSGKSLASWGVVSISMLTIFAAIVWFDNHKPAAIGPARWQVVSVPAHSATHGWFPARAQAIIAAVRDFFPNARFDVHALYQDYINLDPILEVILEDPATGADIRRCVLVWDENGEIVSPPT